jgi:hypothetical protein
MITKQYENWGSQAILTLSGVPSELSKTVNDFTNFGMFPGESIPAEYDPEKHSRVTIAATKARILPALRGIVEYQMANAPEHATERKALKGKPGAVFQNLARERAEALFAEFQQVKLSVVADETERKGDLRDYDVDESEISPALRAQGRRLLASIFGAQRDSASRAGKGFSE